MRIIKIFSIIAPIIIVVCLLALILPKSNIENAAVIIAEDYSTITYNGNIYVPIQRGLLPSGLDFHNNKEWIKATVEGQNYFLDKFFLTNYISVTEYNGEKFIYLNTDYDVNESDYYCLPSYKDNAKSHSIE